MPTKVFIFNGQRFLVMKFPLMKIVCDTIKPVQLHVSATYVLVSNM